MMTNRLSWPFLLLMVLVIVGCGATSPESTVEQFYDRIEKGEIEDALELISSTIRSQVGDDKLKLGMQSATHEIAQKEGIDKLSIDQDKIIGEVAEVTATLIYGNGKEDNATIHLVKEDGKWMIASDK